LKVAKFVARTVKIKKNSTKQSAGRNSEGGMRYFGKEAW